MIQPDKFYVQLNEALALPASQRHSSMSALHTQVMTDYVNRLKAITEAEALMPVTVGDDHRTVLQIVGHIAEWERFLILSATDMLIGLEHPRLVTSLDGYIALDGSTPTFDTISGFNAYFAEQHRSWSWEKMQPFAIDTTTILHQMFTQVLNGERIERTMIGHKKLGNGDIIPKIAVGWTVWLIGLEHLAIEHVVELGLV